MSKRTQGSSQNHPPLDHLSYSIKSLSNVTDIGTTTLYLDAKEGRLKARKVGSKLIVPKKDAIEYLDNLPTAMEG